MPTVSNRADTARRRTRSQFLWSVRPAMSAGFWMSIQYSVHERGSGEMRHGPEVSPRNNAERFWLTASPFQIRLSAFATDPFVRRCTRVPPGCRRRRGRTRHVPPRSSLVSTEKHGFVEATGLSASAARDVARERRAQRHRRARAPYAPLVFPESSRSTEACLNRKG